MKRAFVGCGVAALTASVAAFATQEGRPQQMSSAVKQYVTVAAPVVALTNIRVIDGTGAPAREQQTLLIKDGTIAEVGDSRKITVPAGATVLDLAGKSVIPGLVMVHEHLYYPTGPQVYGQLGQSFIRFYLAGGVTTMRTGGNVNGFMDFKLKRLIEEGRAVGPAIDATVPYLNGPNPFLQLYELRDTEEARRHVEYWADMGATSFKAYMNITRAQLGVAIEAAHKRGMKMTGHLCSVTYAEAADLGIDNLEHGFLASTDFVSDKQPDNCPGQARGQQSIAALDENSNAFKALVKKLVDRKVALTSTLTVFETLTPGRPLPPGLDVLVPQLRKQFEENHSRTAARTDSIHVKLLPKAMALEYAFARAGGLLIAGTDPTGGGGVVPGYSNHRQIELLVEAGFTPVQAIAIATHNGAQYLGRAERIGTIAAGKQADLVVLAGDPSRTVADVRKVEAVFKAGVGYDPTKLVESVRNVSASGDLPARRLQGHMSTRWLDRRQLLRAALAMATLPGASSGQSSDERLGASTACLAGLSLLDAITELGRLGFATIEMIAYTGARHSVGDIPGFAYDRASPAERDLVFKATRPFRHISAHLPFQDVRLFSSDVAERRAGLARLQSAMDGLAFLRGEMAVMHLGWPDKGRRFRDIWQAMVDTLRWLGDFAAKRNLKVGIETMQPDSVREYTDLIAATNHASVGAVIDTGHIRGSTDIGLAADRRDTDEARARFNHVLNTLVTSAGEKVFHLHLSDVRRTDWTDHREIGTGIIDFSRLFASLRRIAFRALYVLELEESDTIGALERSRTYVEKLTRISAK